MLKESKETVIKGHTNTMIKVEPNELPDLSSKLISSTTCTSTSYKKGLHITRMESCRLNELAKMIYDINVEKGFHQDLRHEEEKRLSFPARIALVHSELSEALEADRKDLMDEKLPWRHGREVELADALIRILDMAAVGGMDIEGAVFEKISYNKTRPFMHGGKKY